VTLCMAVFAGGSCWRRRLHHRRACRVHGAPDLWLAAHVIQQRGGASRPEGSAGQATRTSARPTRWPTASPAAAQSSTASTPFVAEISMTHIIQGVRRQYQRDCRLLWLGELGSYAAMGEAGYGR
jgi:hypothetical protein